MLPVYIAFRASPSVITLLNRQRNEFTIMTTLPVCNVPGITRGRRRSLLRRAVAWFLEPGIGELDARTLADIGASQTLRAHAEWRAAWRRGLDPARWHGL